MVFKRLRDITLATIHEGLDALENPVAMLNQYLRDMEAEIEKAEAAVVKQSMIEKKFIQYRDEAQHMVDKRMRQAYIDNGDVNTHFSLRRTMSGKKVAGFCVTHLAELLQQLRNVTTRSIYLELRWDGYSSEQYLFPLNRNRAAVPIAEPLTDEDCLMT